MSGSLQQEVAVIREGDGHDTAVVPAFGIDERVAELQDEEFADSLSLSNRQIELPQTQTAILESDLEPANLTGNDALGHKTADDKVVMLGDDGQMVGDTALPEEAIGADRNSEAMTDELEEKQEAAFEIDAERDVMDEHVQQHRQMGAFDISDTDFMHSQGVPVQTVAHQDNAMMNEHGKDQSHSLGYGH